jgi:SAM-dependent methyltransferase
MTDNAEQVEYWNGPGAARWVHHQEVLDRMLEPFGRAILEVAGLQRGERVVDVGCGCGWTALTAAEAVGPAGIVLGVDVSAPMLEHARGRARARGLSNVTFTAADASTHAFDASFDLLMSRFGVMFFRDPTAAFTNLRTALRSEGRVAFVCWGPVADNPWFRVPMASAGTVLPLPEPPAPDEPGPFSFADRARVQAVLARAGFGDVRVERSSPALVLGANVEEAATHAVDTGPVSRLLLDADDATRARVQAAIRESLRPYLGEGGVSLPSAAWIVRATRTHTRTIP